MSSRVAPSGEPLEELAGLDEEELELELDEDEVEDEEVEEVVGEEVVEDVTAVDEEPAAPSLVLLLPPSLDDAVVGTTLYTAAVSSAEVTHSKERRERREHSRGEAVGNGREIVLAREGRSHGALRWVQRGELRGGEAGGRECQRWVGKSHRRLRSIFRSWQWWCGKG